MSTLKTGFFILFLRVSHMIWTGMELKSTLLCTLQLISQWNKTDFKELPHFCHRPLFHSKINQLKWSQANYFSVQTYSIHVHHLGHTHFSISGQQSEVTLSITELQCYFPASTTGKSSTWDDTEKGIYG